MKTGAKIKPLQVIGLIFVAMVLGYLSWNLPFILIPTDHDFATTVSLLSLIATGTILGFWGSWLGMLVAPATSLQFILWSFVEAKFGLAPHNLLPFEIPMYMVLAFPGILGATIGYVLRGLILKDWHGPVFQRKVQPEILSDAQGTAEGEK